jgi:hypothetical protein
MRNAAAFQSAIPPAFLENEDPSLPPKPPPKPSKPAANPPSKRGVTWLMEKEVFIDWRSNMEKRFSRWRERPGLWESDPQKDIEYDEVLKEPHNLV